MTAPLTLRIRTDVVKESTFLRQLFRLRQSLNKRNLDVNIVTTHLSETCTTSIRLLGELVQSCTAKSGRGKALAKASTKANSIDAVGLTDVLQSAFPSLYLAIAKINNTPNPETHLDNMVVSMTELFHEALNSISELFTFRVQGSVIADQRATRSKPSRLQATEHQHHPEDDACNGISKLLTKFLQRMLHTLNLELKTSNELLEAYGCVLLDHIGQCLSLQVFAQDSEHIPNDVHPRLVQPKVFRSLKNREIEIRQQAVAQQSQFLVHLLRQFMGLVTDRESLMSTKSPPLLGVRKDPLFQRTFTHSVKSKLQNTLMQGVFGEDDVVFRDSLKIPEASALQHQNSEALDDVTFSDSPEWFIGEIWGLLGWDVLKDFGSGS